MLSDLLSADPDAVKEDPKKEEPKKEDPKKEKPKKEQPKKEQPKKEQPKKKEAAPKVNPKPKVIPKLIYKVCVQNKGEMPETEKGQIAGTTGQALRIEALSVMVTGINGGISITPHIQDKGWTQPSIANAGQWATVGSKGNKLRIECVKIALTGPAANEYSIKYKTHVAQKGWLDWKYDGQEAGTTGKALAIEAIQIMLTTKDGKEIAA